MIKNPKLNGYRESILSRPSHYSSVTGAPAAEGGQEQIQDANETTDQPIAAAVNCFGPSAALKDAAKPSQ